MANEISFEEFNAKYAPKQQDTEISFDDFNAKYAQEKQANNKEQDYPLTRGYVASKASVSLAKSLAIHNYDEAAKNIAEQARYAKANPGSEESVGLQKAWKKGDGILGGIANVAGEIASDYQKADGAIAGAKSLAGNAQAMGSGIVAQMPNMVLPMAGMVGGGLAGSTISPVIGTILGAWSGASTGNALVGTSEAAMRQLEKAGINPEDTEAVKTYLQKNSGSILGETSVKGGVIGAVDTATMGLMHFILTGPGKAAADRALAKLKVDTTNSAAVSAAAKTPQFKSMVASDPVYIASKKGAGNAARNIGAASLEPVGEFTGEYAGSKIATGEADAKDAFLEAASSLGQSGATFAGQKLYAGAKYPFQSGTTPPPSTSPSGSPPPPDIASSSNVDELISATKSSIDVELDNQTNQDLLDEISASNNATPSNAPVDQSYVPQPDTEPRPDINIAPDVQPLIDNAEPLVSGQAQPIIEQSQPIDLSSQIAVEPSQQAVPQPTEGQNVQDIIPETQSQPIELAPETGGAVGVVQEQVTAREVAAVQDIPTTEKMTKAISLVGEEEFKSQVVAKMAKYRPTNENQKAMLVEATAIEILAKGNRSQPTVNSDFTPTTSSTLSSRSTTTPASTAQAVPTTDSVLSEALKPLRTEILKFKGEGKTVTGTKTIYDATDRLKAIAEDTGETSLKAQQVWFNSKRKTLEKNGDIEAAALFERIVAQLKERINTAQEPAPVKIDDQVATVASDVAEKTANVVAPKPKRKVGIPKRMSLLEWVASEGGFNRAEIAAEIGRIDDLKAHKSGIFGSPSFRVKGGQSWDKIGERLAEAGYLPKNEHGQYDKHDLFERIDAELDGEKQYTVDDIEGIAETDKAARELDELRGEAESVGVDWKKYKTIDDLWVAIDAKRFELSDADEALLEDVVADDSADTDFDFGIPVSAAETEAWLNGVEDGQGNQGQANGATAGAQGEGDQRSTDRSSAQGEAEQQTPDREFALTSQTEEDIKQQEERAADTSIADREAADRASEVPLTLAAQSSSNTGSAANQSSMFTPDGRASKAAESRPADPISQMAASVESLAKSVQALVETQRKPDSGIEISTASIDTLNSWKNYPGVIKSVKGWSLFKDPVYEKFVLMRKAKEANKSGGGYVSAERAGYFDTENQASEWAALNSGQNKTDDVSKKAENVDTSKERVKGIDISKNKVFTDDAAAAARAILKKKLGQLNSGLDPEMMQAGITLAGYHIEKGARTFATFARAMIDDLGDAVKPYLKSWYAAIKFDQRAAEFSSSMDSMAEIEAADVNALTGENNVTDEYSGTDLERDSENTNAENGLGEESISNGRGGNVQRGESGIRGTQEEGGAGSSDSLSGRETAPDGERGNLAIYTGATGRGTEDGIAGDSLNQRSNNAGIDGAPIESDAASVTQEVATSGSQLNADKLKQKVADRKEHTSTLENIRLTLPILTEGQQEDVFKAETRFAKEDGYGMLFTNGTGTGKTFTGLGVIKRFFTEGKHNIIIAVPNDKIAGDWQKAGTMLGLDISRLEDTNSAGEGIIITTYSNYGQNNQLAHRNWDLIVHDEAHYLAMDKDGTNTLALHALRALSLHPGGASTRHSMLYADDITKLADLQAKLKNDENNASLKAELNKAEVQHRETREKVKNEVADNQGNKRPRALFLSATPFAYVKTVDWANGYLFDYDEGRSKDTSRSYNTGSNANQFFMQHFGYSMRYNRLTQPDAKVDTGLMQRQFNSYLKKNGTLSGRMLDVKADYDRRFVLVDSAIGTQIDAALQWFEEERKANKGNEDKILAIGKVGEVITEKFDYLSRRYLLESIKAKEVLPHVREHLAMGRKVVVFHDYKKGGGFNPFDLSHRNSDDSAAFNEVVDSFRSKFKSLIQSDVWHSSSPITTFQREFPDVLLFNGEISPKQRRANVEKFQDDASGPQVFLVQSQAGKEGISLHDTTGKHQRVLFNLGQPTQPTTAIQQEGRIYRTGQVTDAIFRYLNTGTNWEKWAFATTASRSSAAENLGMGEHARALKDAFIEAFEESDSNRAGMEGEGKGGKERDQSANNALTEYDRARAFYFGTQKKNSRTKSQEGADYFATPEPVGLTMVQLADIRIGESVLEPSAGHGAIARWMPENAERTAVEPSMSLRPRLAMVFDGKIVDTNFEDLHVSNKYDAIIMNPPFGSAGRTAVDHIAKAATHLRNGGRIVALMPVGSATTKFDKWFYEMEERPVKPLATHPTLGPIYKGDTISSRLAGADDVIAKSAEHGGIMFGLRGSSFSTLTSMEGIYDVKPTGKRTTEFSPAEGLQLVAEIKLPQVTFERAGTAVSTRIIVIEKSGDTKQFVDRDYSDITDINELFDRMENLSIPQRTKAQTDVEPVATQKASKPVVDKVAAKEAADAAGLEIIEHTTSKGKVIRGVVRADLTLNQAKEIDKFTFKKNGGYFIREKHLAANNDDPLFSKSTPTQNTHTVASATSSMLEAHTGKIKAVLQAMLDNGKAKIVTAEQAAGIVGEDAMSSDAQAFYNPADEVTYFVADQIPANYTAEQFKGLVLHEIGVHARELGVGQKEFKSILSQIDLMRKAGNKAVVAAFKRVPKDTRPENVTEEAIAYLLQESPQLSIVQRVLSWFRNAIRAIGKSFPTLQKLKLHDWASKLSEQDLRFMAESALKNSERSVQNESGTPQFSKLSQTATAAFKKWFGESKVVNADGTPMVVYHGTSVDFIEFNKWQHFGTARQANQRIEDTSIGKAAQIKPVFLNITSPIELKDIGSWGHEKLIPELVRVGIISKKYSDVMLKRYRNMWHQLKAKTWEYKNGYEQIIESKQQELNDGLEKINNTAQQEIENIISDAGYDGIKYQNKYEVQISEDYSYIAFSPTQIKSAIGNNGDFSPSNNNILFSKNTNPVTHPFQPENSGKPLDSWIKIFTRNQIVTLYRDSLIGKKLEEYKELRERVTADTNSLFEKADNFLLELRQIPKGLRDTFASLAHDSTLNNVDPSNPKYVPSPDAIKLADYLADNPTNKRLAAKIKKRLNSMEAAHKKLHAEFSALPTKEQDLFKELRSKYTEQMTMVFDEIKKRIGRTKNVDPAIKISSIKKLDEQLADLLGRVYFPLYRAGNYIVKAEKAGEPTTVDHVESNFAADRLEKKLKKLGYTVSRSTRIVSPQDNKSGEALNAVRDLLDKAALGGKIEGAALSQLIDDIDQTVIQSLPDQSYRKSFIHRKGTKGYSDDFIRAYADAMRRGSINIANLRHGDKIATVIEDMRKDVKDASKVPGSNVAALNQVVDRVEQIEVDIRNPTSKLVSVSGKIAFAQMLGSLSNFILNLTQIPLLTMPHLGAEYGYGKANLQLAMAFAKQMRSLKKQGTLSELGKWLDMRHGLVGNELDLMQQLHDSGFLDLTQSFDLIDAANNPSYQENELSMNVMKVIALPQHVSEIVNRQVTALATIRLEMARSGSPLKAYRAAIKAIDETHFNYSKENRSKLMTGNTQSMLFKFKQYPQQAAFLFVRTAKLALDGSTNLDSDGNKLDGTRPSERTKARKQLAGVLGMQILVAGTLGLPVFAEAAVAASGVAGFKLAGSTGAYVGVAGAIILAAALAFGDDDGEEFDVEVKKWFIKHFGEGIGSSLADGIIPRGLASRLNASELVIRRPEEARNSTDFANQWMISLLGAFWGGTVYNAGVGLKDIVEGDTAKGATKLIPVKAIKDLVTSWKWANDGMNVTNKDGEIITPVSKADIFFKSIGINPTSVVNAREYDNAKFTLHNALLKKQQKALKELREETDKTKRFNAIIKYNKSAPLGYEIDSDKVRGVIAREIKYKGKPNVVTGNPVQEDYLNKNTKELRPAY